MSRFCVFPSRHYVAAVVLWIAHTHSVDAFELTPRLAFVSETKQTGKSRALEVIDLAAFDHALRRFDVDRVPVPLDRDVVPNAVVRRGGRRLGPKARDNEELRSLINVGFRRSATVGRCVGDSSTPKEFPAFCPVALAGIGDCLPDTVVDRAIVLRMRPQHPDESIEALRYRRVRPEATELQEHLAAWGAAHVDGAEGADPVMPDGITDRPADAWEALLAVADAAGGAWPERAHTGISTLNDARSAEDPNVSIRLLGDIRQVLDSEHIFSVTLCQHLNDLEESPWAGWSDGKGIRPVDLAKQLKGFGIKSKDVRIGDAVRKGYTAEEFAETFDRYLPPGGYKGNRGNAPGSGVAPVAPVALARGGRQRPR